MSTSGASRSVEVFIVDTQSAAARALALHRPTAESTHVLCRHADESTAEFSKRVLERTRRLQSSRRIRSLWYVVGSESAEGPGSVTLLNELLARLDSGANLTLVGPASRQERVLHWVDSLIARHGSALALRAQFYPDVLPAVAREAAAPERRAPLRSSPQVTLGRIYEHAEFESDDALAESA